MAFNRGGRAKAKTIGGAARLKPARRAENLSKRSQKLSARSASVAEKAKSAIQARKAGKLSKTQLSPEERAKRLEARKARGAKTGVRGKFGRGGALSPEERAKRLEEKKNRLSGKRGQKAKIPAGLSGGPGDPGPRIGGNQINNRGRLGNLKRGKYRTASDGSPLRDSGNQINNRGRRPSSSRFGNRKASDGSPVATRSGRGPISRGRRQRPEKLGRPERAQVVPIPPSDISPGPVRPGTYY